MHSLHPDNPMQKQVRGITQKVEDFIQQVGRKDLNPMYDALIEVESVFDTLQNTRAEGAVSANHPGTFEAILQQLSDELILLIQCVDEVVKIYSGVDQPDELTSSQYAELTLLLREVKEIANEWLGKYRSHQEVWGLPITYKSSDSK